MKEGCVACHNTHPESPRKDWKVGDVRGIVETMREIVTRVQRVSDMMGEISAAASEQSAGIGQINTAVMQLDEMTQQNAALVEQSALQRAWRARRTRRTAWLKSSRRSNSSFRAPRAASAIAVRIDEMPE